MLELMDLSAWQVVAVAAVGLVAGVLGGMLGVGGSLIMIPALTVVLGPNQHLYQAAAMLANVAVAVPAARRHRQAGAMRFDVLKRMLPAAVLCVILGVWLSNAAAFQGSDGQRLLSRVFGGFLVYVIGYNLWKLRQSTMADAKAAAGEEDGQEQVTAGRCVATGGVMGLVAGLLGIGGGAVAVPLQQTLLGLPLRVCIANSSAVIVCSAGFGAVYKNASLAVATEGALTWRQGVMLGLLLAPTCFVGGRLGAVLTHRLPLRQVRVAFLLLLAAAAWRMLVI